MQGFSTVTELLNWVLFSGGAVLVASWVLDRIPGFTNGVLTPGQKKLITLAADLVLSLGAYAILTYVPAETLAVINPWIQVISTIVVVWAGGQVVHKLSKG